MKTLIHFISSILVLVTMNQTIYAKVLFTEKVGGTKGAAFMLPSSRASILATEDIVGIAIQHGRRIEQIVLIYADAKQGHQMESIGNDDGDWSFIQLEKGEFITYVTGRAGTLIDQISFHTSLRRTFGPFGGPGGIPFELNIPSNAKVIGFTGTAGPSIQSIGLIYRTYESGKDQRSTNKGSRIIRGHRNKNVNALSQNKTKGEFTIRDTFMINKTMLLQNITAFTPIASFKVPENNHTNYSSPSYKPKTKQPAFFFRKE